MISPINFTMTRNSSSEVEPRARFSAELSSCIASSTCVWNRLAVCISIRDVPYIALRTVEILNSANHRLANATSISTYRHIYYTEHGWPYYTVGLIRVSEGCRMVRLAAPAVALRAVQKREDIAHAFGQDA